MAIRSISEIQNIVAKIGAKNRYVLPLAITNTTKIHFQNSTPIKTKKKPLTVFTVNGFGSN